MLGVCADNTPACRALTTTTTPSSLLLSFCGSVDVDDDADLFAASGSLIDDETEVEPRTNDNDGGELRICNKSDAADLSSGVRISGDNGYEGRLTKPLGGAVIVVIVIGFLEDGDDDEGPRENAGGGG